MTLKIKHVSPYAQRRKKEYPSLEEQLDYLWHAMDKGELPKVSGFYDRIKDIKDKYPKASKPI